MAEREDLLASLPGDVLRLLFPQFTSYTKGRLSITSHKHRSYETRYQMM